VRPALYQVSAQLRSLQPALELPIVILAPSTQLPPTGNLLDDHKEKLIEFDPREMRHLHYGYAKERAPGPFDSVTIQAAP
jgi:hypothetical protein